MEALAALGVAAAVVQFVDYSSRLVAKGQHLYHSANGTLAENMEMEEASERLKALTDPLLATQGEGATIAICQACVAVSNELMAYLIKLKVPPGHPNRRWKSFRQALKSVSSKNDIKDIKLRLESLRAELETHVVLGIRNQISGISILHDARFTALDTATQNIMVDLLEFRRIVREDMGNQFQHLIRSEHLEHSKTRAVLSDHTTTQLQIRVSQSIIESLHYPTRTVRHETIPQAHKRTFKWIFQDPVAKGKPWSHFGNWLKTGDGIYWINGKAGSGKSTLMKFIVDHNKTRELLGVWAQGATLETPSFFFWKAGDTNQRSQEGLLRSLLYDVLQKHHELVPIIFPDIWKRNSELTSNNIPHTFSNWTYAKLKDAFARLVAVSGLRICFFIDGLDEYDGDFEDLAQYFSGLSCSSHVKLCLSSRPWPAFLDAFQDCASLKLQDLTRDDIYRYVNDKMKENTKMVSLRQKESQRTSAIIESLIRKAQGVFLWVTLVVKSLLKGLSHRNSLENLEKRLNAIPTDLENLYNHMLSSIDKGDLEDGSKMFQLCAAFDRASIDMDLVYHALISVKAFISPFSAPEDSAQKSYTEYFDSIVREMDTLLQTRCGGLLEIHVEEATDEEWKSGSLSYIHRTVLDFLDTPNIWKQILSHTLDTSWNPRTALLTASVICLQRITRLESYDREQSICFVKCHWSRFLRQTYAIFDRRNPPTNDIIALLDEFDTSASQIAVSYDWSENNETASFDHWSNKLNYYTLSRPNLLFLSAESGLWFYVKYHLEHDHSKLWQQHLETPLLAHAILGRVDSGNSRSIIKTIRIILGFHADPNEFYHGHSLWQCWVSILHTAILFFSAESIEAAQRGTVAMLEAGADLEVQCIENDNAWQEIFRVEDPESCFVSWAGLSLVRLKGHSKESWRDPKCQYHGAWYSSEQERSMLAGKEALPFRERHCLKAVIENAFRKNFPDGADEILQLIDKLKAKKASRHINPPIKNGKRKIEEVEDE